jgi:hypothetical protein
VLLSTQPVPAGPLTGNKLFIPLASMGESREHTQTFQMLPIDLFTLLGDLLAAGFPWTSFRDTAETTTARSWCRGSEIAHGC